MRVVVQRVKSASCHVDGKLTGKINQGLFLLVSFTHTDTKENCIKMARKIAGLRVFSDENDKMNLSLKDVNGEILSISQFTLYGDTNKGFRPSFVNSMKAEEATGLYDFFNEELRKYDIKVETGIFGADMILDPICDGPVTLLIEF